MVAGGMVAGAFVWSSGPVVGTGADVGPAHPTAQDASLEQASSQWVEPHHKVAVRRSPQPQAPPPQPHAADQLHPSRVAGQPGGGIEQHAVLYPQEPVAQVTRLPPAVKHCVSVFV